MRPWSGLTWVLLLAGAVVVALATFRIQTPGGREPKPGERIQRDSVVSPPQEPANTPEQTALLERIFATWKKRQEQAATFHFVWDSRVTRPEADSIVALPRSGWWEDRDGRFREDSIAVEYDDNGFWRQIAGLQCIHDGALNSRLSVPQGTGGSPWMTIWRGDVRNRVGVQSPFDLMSNGRSNFLPLLLSVRPMHADPSWDPAKWQVANEDAVANDVHCVEIHRRDRFSQFDTFWVDPKRDDVVVRWKGQNYFDAVEIDYRRDPKHGWIPSRWSWSRQVLQPTPELVARKLDLSRKGNRSASPFLFDVTVRSYSIGEPLPADTFAQTHPANTVVYDATAGSKSDWKSEQSPPDESKEARATLEAIRAAWAKRKAKLQSFEVTGQRNRMLLVQDWLLGPAKSNFTARGQGDRFELEFDGQGAIPRYPGSKNSYGLPIHGKTAFDGVETRALTGGSGRKRTGAVFDAANDGDCVWVAFCPWDARLTGLDPARFQLVAQDTKVGDAKCAMIRCERSPGCSFFLWLDRSRDFLVLRRHEVINGVDSSRADFSYRADADRGWIPTSWKEVRVGSRWESRFSVDDSVKEVRLNQPIPASAFAIDFPKSVAVEDLDPEPLRNEKARNQVAAAIAERWTKPLDAKAPPKPQYDPKFDARVELEKAEKAARETKRRVLIEFGGQGHADCVPLYETLTQNAEIAAVLKKSFVLVLVDTDYRDAGQIVLNEYVPENKQGPFPLLTVMDPDETVRDTTDPAPMKSGNSYAIESLNAYLEKWAPKK